ncbi:MAG TPA: hypothetical protein VF957_15085 [Bradyrhizobium sp.]|jgi:hypothetical protein
MGGFVYGGRFEQMMNEHCSPKKIGATAKKFAKLEKQHGDYAFGKFAQHFLPKPEEFSNWSKDAGAIPESIRKRLTEVISTNLKSKSPMPMMLKVGDNVDATHDLHVKTFAHKGHMYIGVHMLCPNTSLK